MGASHATLSSTVESQDSMELQGYTVEQRLYPGSGRMMRTFRLKHTQSDAVVVCKSMWVSQDDKATLKDQQEELKRIKAALKGQSHVAPFVFWNVGTSQRANILPVHLVRPHVYTTLSDRVASRPFLTHVEKLLIVHQLLHALEEMRKSDVVHGFLTTENVGLTSWNYVVLLDIASYKSRTALPDDDPSEYLYYFQECNKHGTDTTPREKRCYIAPERFYTPSSTTFVEAQPLTPAMDIFSAGCVVMELFLNGERALDLGELMDYRRSQKLTSTLQQKLNKIESSSLRAACRHMLHLTPTERLSARDYRDKLSTIFPSTFDAIYTPLLERITCTEVTPDARMAVVASYYEKVVRATVGINDSEGVARVKTLLGPTMVKLEAGDTDKEEEEAVEKENTPEKTNNTAPKSHEDMLLAETEALLKKLESPSFDDDDEDPLSIISKMPPHNEKPIAPPSPEDASSLLIYLQLVLSTIRTVQRPSSKLVGLQLLERLGRYSSDESKLQRIVPATVSLSQDQDALVRASALQVMTWTLATIQTFAPSDSKIFPQYIFKRVAHLNNDPCLVVRVAFAQCIASLADTSHRFLDISHAVRLYEAVGGGGSGGEEPKGESLTPGVFTEDVANLLDDNKTKKGMSKGTAEDADKEASNSRKSSMSHTSVTTSTVGRTLISSTYTAELAALQEIVSRWVVHIATDQSDQSSPPKRSLLCDLARLCNFFGGDGVMAFILPQILAFLNDRRDWQLRAALFERLASVCSIIGRAATEHFVLPCLETALVDAQDLVMGRALQCLASLVEMGLLSRSVLVTPQSVLPMTGLPDKPKRGLFEKYVPLLVYPSSSVRHSAVVFVNTCCRSLGFPDAFVFLLPHLRPYLRFEPSTTHLTDGLERCMLAPWSRSKLNEELVRVAERSKDAQLGTQWTSVEDISMEVQEEKADAIGCPAAAGGGLRDSSRGREVMNEQMIEYLTMLHRSRGSNASVGERQISDGPAMTIDGSLKLAQHVKFPDQRVAGTLEASIPSWYASLRDSSDIDESSAIRSVSTLSQVYGLSVIEAPTVTESRVSKDAVIFGQTADLSTQNSEAVSTDVSDDSFLRSSEAKMLQAAATGEWGCDVRIDPTVADTALLVTKMKGLDVPPLPPNIGVVEKCTSLPSTPGRGPGGDSKGGCEWRPRADSMIASSSFTDGHSGPVSRLAVAPDEKYFVSASYDGTLRVWETRQVQDSDGVLVSSATYSGHLDGFEQGHPRINDVASLENSESVVSAASDGSLHIWRVDMVSKSPGPVKTSLNVSQEKRGSDRSRVSGCSTVLKVYPEEGEIHAVSHFNTLSASVVVFATQGVVHSLDLRQAREPFKLKHQPDTGYLTSMALGSDSHWVITGTSRGFVALWDIRFQQMVKLWQHPSKSPVTRLATTYASLPKKWGDRAASVSESRPFMFVACGQNECGMFDVTNGSARDCFRVIGPRSRATDSSADRNVHTAMPVLRQMDLSYTSRKPMRVGDLSRTMSHAGRSGPSINALVGNVGGSEHSYMFTGGEDGLIRHWDFATPSKCFTVSGHQGFHHRPTYERVDYDGQRLILCRQAPIPRPSEIENSRFPRTVERGPFRPENRHSDSITDLKLFSFPERLLVSCSRDSTVKVWR